jgi:Na+/H+ antiporter NhaD/arsenite permease-like protein
MTCVSILAETGFLEWVAIYIAKLMKGDAVKILVSMLIVTMIFSALLDNVTTIILLAPVTILISQLLEIPTLPFLILEAIASNIGGTATLIGDPPNIIIGSMAELSFNDFLINLSPGVAIIAVVFIISSVILMRKHLNVPDHIKERVNKAYPELAIRDSKNMKRSLIVFLIIFIGFFIHHSFDLEPGIVALGGMCIMLVVCKSHTENMLKAVEETSNYTIKKINKIKNQLEITIEKVKKEAPKIYRKELIELLFEQPYSKIEFVVDKLKVERKAAS